VRVYVLLVLIATGAAFSPRLAAEPARPDSELDRDSRVRTNDPRVRATLAEGMARSATFRDVLDRVQAHDVIVYIEMQPRLRGRLSGVVTWVAATKSARYVRIGLNPELPAPALIAALAHELQHVAEIGEAPSVVDERSLSALYRGIGTERRVASDAWDTEAAKLTGEVVRKELATANQNQKVDPLVLSRAFSGRH
jgi:hypothetical protein